MPRSIPPAGGPPAYLDAPPRAASTPAYGGEGPLDATGVPQDRASERSSRQRGIRGAQGPVQLHRSYLGRTPSLRS
eukprot:12977804-Alexandrium_andersonii.AAC.1